jgi:very-short-patch-repair endonuclease
VGKTWVEICGESAARELISRLSEIRKKIWKDPVYVAKQMKARRVKPNKLEEVFNSLLQGLLPNQYKYVGDGEVIIGGKCPDFINVNGQKKIIELFGDYWHGPERTGQFREEHEQERIEHFAEYGYQTLIIWESELEDIDDVAAKLGEFCQPEK